LPTPESLYIIGATTASESFVTPLGNGNDGEEIAYNPDSGLILHASGIGGNRILENTDPVTLAISPLTITGAYPFEVAGLTYAGGGDFNLPFRRIVPSLQFRRFNTDRQNGPRCHWTGYPRRSALYNF
jgi:hypothetical protein